MIYFLGGNVLIFKRKLIVTDDIVYDLYKDYMKDCEVIVIPAGEQSKSHEMLFKIYDKIIKWRDYNV